MKRSQSPLESGDLLVRDPQPVGDAERHREVCSQVEELVLNAHQDLAQLVRDFGREHDAEQRVQLIHGAERRDPAVQLRDARAVSEARLATVAAARVDTGQADRLIPLAGHGHRLRPVELRPARVDEKDALARLFQRSRAGWTFVPPVPDEALPRIADGIFERHEEVWLAEENGRLLGFLAVARSERHGWEVLEKLYVEPEAQNRGVGTALLDQAKALRPDGFVLWVFQRNEGARRFYERHGFELVKLTDGAENMEREPDALYRWSPLGRVANVLALGYGQTSR